MLARALLVSFQQALRSIALTLFPLTFIAMLAWATAGSSSGNTTDPIRASIWLWLGAHLVPFNVTALATHQAGTLSLLPLGGVILPMIAMRTGYKRTLAVVQSPKGSRILFGSWYLIIAISLTLLSQSDSVSPSLLQAPIFIVLAITISTLDYSHHALKRLALPLRSVELLLGLSLLAVALSLTVHFSIVKNLTTVIAPGWMGGLLFLILQILYLPNLAVYALSYFAGFGIHIGAATLLSPMHFTLHQIPAISLMGALPTGKHPLLMSSIVILVGVAFLIFRGEVAINKKFGEKFKSQLLLVLLFTAALTALTYLSSGTLITQELKPVGVIFWQLPAAFLALQIIFAILFLAIPFGLSRLLAKRA